MGGWAGHGGPGGYDDGNDGSGRGPWGGWGHSKGPDGYYRVGPSGTCTDGLVTSTAIVTSTITDAQGAVQTSVGQEIRTATVVRLEEVDGEATSAVSVPLAAATGGAQQVGVKPAAALVGLAIGVVAVL